MASGLRSWTRVLWLLGPLAASRWRAAWSRARSRAGRSGGAAAGLRGQKRSGLRAGIFERLREAIPGSLGPGGLKLGRRDSELWKRSRDARDALMEAGDSGSHVQPASL